MRWAAWTLILSLAGVILSSTEASSTGAYSPARYRAGALPPLPAAPAGGGEVFLELAVGTEGNVTAVTPLRTTPPFADLLAGAVRGWRFRPAEEDVTSQAGRSRVRVASKVLVAGVFRPPSLNTPVIGETPRDAGAASDEVALPLTSTVPPFPPLARSAGVVLVEVRVDPDGSVGDAVVIRSAPPFDEPARLAALQWTFRPARVNGEPVRTFAYLVFGFRVPIGAAPRVPRRP